MDLTTGQAERFQTWLLERVDESEAEAEKSRESDRWYAYWRGQAAAYTAAEQALRVASVGALPLNPAGPTR